MSLLGHWHFILKAVRRGLSTQCPSPSRSQNDRLRARACRRYTESALLSKPGTIGFHYLTEDLEAETTALLNVDGQQSLQDDYFFIIRKDQARHSAVASRIPLQLMTLLNKLSRLSLTI